MYIKDQKHRKTINEYAGLITKIRNEYAQIQKENNQLRMEIQKYQIYIQYNQNILEKYRKPNFEKPKKKKIQYYDESDESNESESYTEIRRPKQPKKRRILYEDEIDGIPYEPDLSTEDKKQERTIIMKVKNQNQKEKIKA